MENEETMPDTGQSDDTTPVKKATKKSRGRPKGSTSKKAAESPKSTPATPKTDDSCKMFRERVKQFYDLSVHASASKGDDIEKLLKKGATISNEIIRMCPNSRARSLALTKVEEAILWAVKSVQLPE